MSILSSYLLLDANEQASNKYVATQLFPTIMDGVHQVPNDEISGWSKYVRPNGTAFWVYVDGYDSVCIETDKAKESKSIVDAEPDYDPNISDYEISQFVSKICPSIRDNGLKQRVIQSHYRIQAFYTHNGNIKWILNIWSPTRWSLCNTAYEYM